MKTFAKLLVLYTKRAGISDAELARAIGVSRQTIFRWKEGATNRPSKREDILAISKKLRLQQEEQNDLLLAAGFRPEENPLSHNGDSNISRTDSDSEIDNESQDFLLRSRARQILLSPRLIILIIVILSFIVIMALIDWLHASLYNPFD